MAVPLPDGMKAQLQLSPKAISGTTRRIRLHHGPGSGTLSNRTHAAGFIDAHGVATIRPILLGSQRVRIAMDPFGRGHYLYSIKPRSFEITGTEQQEIVLEVHADRLRRTLDRMEKR